MLDVCVGESRRLRRSEIPEVPAAERPAWLRLGRLGEAVNDPGSTIHHEEGVPAGRHRVRWVSRPPCSIERYTIMAFEAFMASRQAPCTYEHVGLPLDQEWVDYPSGVQVRLDDELHEVGHDVRRTGQLGHCVHPVGDKMLLDVASDVVERDVPPSLGLAFRCVRAWRRSSLSSHADVRAPGASDSGYVSCRTLFMSC